MTAVLLKILSPVECAAVAKFLRRTGTVAAMAKDLGDAAPPQPPTSLADGVAQESATTLTSDFSAKSAKKGELGSESDQATHVNPPDVETWTRHDKGAEQVTAGKDRHFDYCATCGAGEFADEGDRLTVDYAAGYGVIVPCPECAPERHAAYRQRVSQAQADDGIERRDPWDVPESEQIHGGLTGAEMAAAEESYERGRIYYTSRGAVRGVSPRYRDDD